MTTTRSRPLAERLTDAVAECVDPAAVASTIFGLVGSEIEFDFGCIAVTDPATGLITSAFKSRELAGGDEAFMASEYGGPDINQFSELAERPSPVGVLSVDTGGHPELCRRMSDYITPAYGFTEEIRLVCRAQQVSWAALGIYRLAAGSPFTAADGRRLAAVHEQIALAFRRVLFARVPGVETTESGPAVVIIDHADRVTDMSAAAEKMIMELGGWQDGSVPTSVSAVAAAARSSGEGRAALAPGRSGGWLSVQATALAGPARSVVLSIGRATPAAVGQLALAARGLTMREQEVVRLVLQGASTKDISATLHLSPHTVQDHLKAVFEKLGVNSRREVVAQFVR